MNRPKFKTTTEGHWIACGCLIIHRTDRGNTSILLLKRGPTAPTYPGHWGGAGGLQEEDLEETPAQTAAREANEECGIETKLPDNATPFFTGVWPGIPPDFPPRDTSYFLVKFNGNRPRVEYKDGEANAHVWATYEMAIRLPLSFLYHEAIEALRVANHL